jgi:hypothetical protein
MDNGQNCSILSQNVPKFELYKHNDELFNMYYRILYVLWTFADFDRLCKLEKRGDEIKKNLLLWNYCFSNGGHLGYRTALTDTIFKGDHLRIISAKFGWNWLSSFRGEDIFFNFIPQKVPKFELYKHNDELFSIYYGIFYELWNFADFDRLCK